jgi:hypothetical protein
MRQLSTLSSSLRLSVMTALLLAATSCTTTWPKSYESLGVYNVPRVIGYYCPSDYYYQSSDHTCRYAKVRVMPTEQESKQMYYRELHDSKAAAPIKAPQGHKSKQKSSAAKILHSTKVDCTYILDNINKCTTTGE